MAKILNFEDDRTLSQELEDGLMSIGYEVVRFGGRLDAANEQAVYLNPDIVFIKPELIGNFGGGDLLHNVKQILEMPVILMNSNWSSAFSNKARMDCLGKFV
jgi:DNA-binding response OmpR family regulator